VTMGVCLRGSEFYVQGWARGSEFCVQGWARGSEFCVQGWARGSEFCVQGWARGRVMNESRKRVLSYVFVGYECREYVRVS
jgi:hypothetical protein